MYVLVTFVVGAPLSPEPEVLLCASERPGHLLYSLCKSWSGPVEGGACADSFASFSRAFLRMVRLWLETSAVQSIY